MSDRPEPTPRVQKLLLGGVAAGAGVVAGIGFVGSYNAVRALARAKGFGWFSDLFPIGIDAGIVVLLALDMFLTWKRFPFPLLRQTAWLLTAGTIAFNAATAWPDSIGVGMHAAIPLLFIVIVEAGRHAVGRMADITADRHIEPVRITRWLLSPLPTFRLWRRMKLWEVRSYQEVIRREQDRLVYRVRLRAKYGRNWRAKAPVDTRIPLRLAKYGIPVGGDEKMAPADLADGPGVLATPELPVATTPVDPGPADPAGAPAANSAPRQEAAPAAAERPAPAASAPPVAPARKRTATGKSTGRKAPRRSKTDWVDLAGPIFHAEFRRLRRQPTADEFATAIEAAGLGRVSESTAKNIRFEILDRTDVPALDESD